MATQKRAARDGDLSFDLEGGAVRGVRFGGVEVVRMIDYPIRDASWRTLAVEEIAEERSPEYGLRRRFRSGDGAFRGAFELQAGQDGDVARVEARLELVAERDVEVNRAGFVLLHPVAGVAGAPLEATHADGSREATAFPELISPGQLVVDIVGLRHRVGPVEVAIEMEGEVFEMEDQRNWTDASYKTYCRPLSLPRPYLLAAGDVVRQRIVVTLTRGAAGAAAVERAGAFAARAPEIALAHEPALGGRAPAAAAGLGVAGLLLRVDGADPAIDAAGIDAPLTLEVVVGDDPAGDLARVAAACAAAGAAPARVVALPRAYLASHQPDGPWPGGPTPADAAAAARAAFPGAAIGGGMLTNFTELNRRPPDPAAVDFVTFGATAIVHAADDRSVLETLEAYADVFASARALAGGRPLRLGLVSVGMRSNPYGAAVAANPEGARLAMAMDDPRQRGPFAAAFAVALAAEAARGGVESLAPAMAAGPIGLGEDGALWPVFHAVAALAALGGAEVAVAGGPSSGLVTILGQGRRRVAGIAANLGPEAVELVAPKGAGVLVPGPGAAEDAGWIDGPGAAGPALLEPFGVAVFKR